MLTILLGATALLLGLGPLAPLLGSGRELPQDGESRDLAHGIIYLGCAVACAAAAGAALWFLIAGDVLSAAVALPIGLPWLQAHLRVDALSAWFLLVVNLGGLAA